MLPHIWKTCKVHANVCTISEGVIQKISFDWLAVAIRFTLSSHKITKAIYNLIFGLLVVDKTFDIKLLCAATWLEHKKGSDE